MSEMEDLASALAGSFSVSQSEGHSTTKDHPAFFRSQQYKNKGERSMEAGQNNRRFRLLEEQKKRREALLEIKRKNKVEAETEDDEDGDDDVDFTEKVASRDEEKMDINEIARRPQRRRPDQIWNTFKDTLMLSEWLVEVPEDMEKEWLVVPVPVGKRSLLVASNKKTCSFSKGGMPLNTFESQLPNGSRSRRHDSKYLLFDCRNAGDTMVDCIFSPHLFTYFILDLLMWQDYDVRDCDTEFRMWWLHSKLSEMPDSGNIHFSTIRIPCFPCNREGVRQCFSWQPFPNDEVELDGLLFYHKNTAYTAGETPLVGWLKPYMLPEVLGFDIPAWVRKPQNYTDFRSHISEFNEAEAKKRAKHFERVEKRKQKQEEHVAMEMAKKIEPRTSKGSKDSPQMFEQPSKSEEKVGWLHETLEESLERTKNKNTAAGRGPGLLDQVNLDETGSFSKMDELLLERKMDLDAIEVEYEIQEIKRMEMKPGALPLEALSFDINRAKAMQDQVELQRPKGDDEREDETASQKNKESMDEGDKEDGKGDGPTNDNQPFTPAFGQ